MKKHRNNRRQEREGVNAAQAFFERFGCVFQEISLENDYGKDAHVDLGDEHYASSVCAALQIKSGISYRSGVDYKIPLSQDDFEYWSTSTVPVIGLVYDPDDGLLRWINISLHLDTMGERTESKIIISRAAVLTETALRGAFIESIRSTGIGHRRHPLAQLCERSSSRQGRAVVDCFALGRADPRLLVGLRYLMFQLTLGAFKTAIYALAHLTPHPDIFFHSNNWVTGSVRDEVRRHFRWSIEELIALLRVASREDWERGQIGQHIYMLLVEDPAIDEKLRSAAAAVAGMSKDTALMAIHLLVSRASEDGRNCLDSLMRELPALRSEAVVEMLYADLADFGYVSFW